MVAISPNAYPVSLLFGAVGSLAAHPAQIVPSEEYCALLNRILQENGAPFSLTVTPGSNASAVNVTAEKEPVDLGQIQTFLTKAREVVEGRRRRVVEVAARQMLITPSPTLDHLDEATRPERLWLQRVAEPLARIANDLYAAQTSPWSECIDGWMARHGDAASLWHYHRIRTPNLPGLLPAFIPSDVPDAALYASSVAFFPRRPAYHAMLPADFSEEELAHLRNFPQDHPIRLPYTVVERLTEEEASTLGEEKASLIVRGLGDRPYRVTHMRFHPRYSRHFEEFAEILERNADVSVDGEALDPGFRDYTLRMAGCLRGGDFLDLLRADLEQSSGNILLTFFPHEGSWADNLKFPWMFEIGIRSRSLSETMSQRGDAFSMLEGRARGIAEACGAPAPNRPVEPVDVERMFQLIWVYRNGGFARAFPHGEPGGHDYPKIDLPGIRGHRAVVMADTVMATEERDKRYAEEFLSAEDAALVTGEAMLLLTIWHEGSHGVLGNKPDTPLADGRTLGQVYANLWGRLVEPQSDAAFAVVNNWLRNGGRVTREEYDRMLRAAFIVILKRMAPPERLWEPSYDSGHEAGATMTFGWLLQTGVVEPLDEGRFDVAWDRMAESLERLWVALTHFAFDDSTRPFREFVDQCVASIPSPTMDRILGVQRRLRTRRLLTRGDVSPLSF
jgi:hypothetical protein